MLDVEKLWATITTAIVGGIAWLIRRVITNEKQIALLEQSLKQRDEDIKEIKGDIKDLLKQKGR